MALNDKIIAVERFTSITLNDDLGNAVMTLRMAEFVEAVATQINQNTPLSGTGSPESVLEAEPFRFYIDTAAAAGSNLYVKTTGAGDTGWTLV